MNDTDECKTCTFWQRVGLYLFLRLREPTTWAGIFTMATGVGISIAPAMQIEITSIGTGLVGIFLMAAREGRNKPDNPTVGATISGTMPPPPPAIVPPSTTGLKPLPPNTQLDSDPDGVVHAEPKP